MRRQKGKKSIDYATAVTAHYRIAHLPLLRRVSGCEQALEVTGTWVVHDPDSVTLLLYTLSDRSLMRWFLSSHLMGSDCSLLLLQLLCVVPYVLTAVR
jgi:hypothetical protein